MNATGNDLLQAILDDPASDERRLIYADWLDDQGEAERAEFIRCQIGIWHRLQGPVGPVPLDSPWLANDMEYHRLRRRERELLTARWHLWYGPGMTNRANGCTGVTREDSVGIWHTFRRGFVDEVRCTLVDWCGTECQLCGGSGLVAVWFPIRRKVGKDSCPDCAGTGLVGAHGPAIVECQPVTRVVLTDKQPYSTNGVYCWLAADLHGDEHLPTFLIDILQSLTGTVAASRAIALDAISVACIQWAKAAKKGEDNG